MASLIIFSLLPALSLMKLGIPAGAGATTIHVPDDYASLQKAINNAAPGDTILVREGTYQEDIIVNKSVSLIGADRDLTIIHGQDSQYVVSITSTNVVFINFTVRKDPQNSLGSGVLVSSDGNVIRNNNIVDNYYGMIVYSSHNNLIESNVISNNSLGVSYYFSSSNVFSGNLVADNIEGGISLYFSSNNLFYHNNFNDTFPVPVDSIDAWDYGGEGNFWVNYTGQDTNNDGIGNEPYRVYVENQDNYPLMGMFYDLSIVSGNETRSVNIISNSTVFGLDYEVGGETGNKILHFNVTGEDGAFGFCRIMVPAELMTYPFIVLDSKEEITPLLLNISNETHAYLYFTYNPGSERITLISSKTLQLYNELIIENLRLQEELHTLNATYFALLNSSTSELQLDIYNLNTTYFGLLHDYAALTEDYLQLKQSYNSLNLAYQEHLVAFSQNVQNLQNLTCMFAAMTTIFLLTIIYLSKRAHTLENPS